MELGPSNIRVNSVLPGVVAGERVERVIAARARRWRRQQRRDARAAGVQRVAAPHDAARGRGQPGRLPVFGRRRDDQRPEHLGLRQRGAPGLRLSRRDTRTKFPWPPGTTHRRLARRRRRASVRQNRQRRSSEPCAGGCRRRTRRRSSIPPSGCGPPPGPPQLHPRRVARDRRARHAERRPLVEGQRGRGPQAAKRMTPAQHAAQCDGRALGLPLAAHARQAGGQALLLRLARQRRRAARFIEPRTRRSLQARPANGSTATASSSFIA